MIRNLRSALKSSNQARAKDSKWEINTTVALAVAFVFLVVIPEGNLLLPFLLSSAKASSRPTEAPQWFVAR